MSTKTPDRTTSHAPPQPPAAPTPPPAPQPPAAPTPPPRRGPSIGAMTLGVILIGLGVVALLVSMGVSIPLYAVGPAILIVLGLGVVVSAARGEPDHAGLGFAIFLGVVVAGASFAAAVWDVPVGGGVGDRTHAPSSVAALEDDYRWGMGDMTVDLRGVEFDAGTTPLEVSVVMGQVEVLVPDGVAVAVDTEVAAGDADVLGHRVDGVGIDDDRRTAGFEDADTRLELTVRVGLGEAVVSTG